MGEKNLNYKKYLLYKADAWPWMDYSSRYPLAANVTSFDYIQINTVGVGSDITNANYRGAGHSYRYPASAVSAGQRITIVGYQGSNSTAFPRGDSLQIYCEGTSMLVNSASGKAYSAAWAANGSPIMHITSIYGINTSETSKGYRDILWTNSAGNTIPTATVDVPLSSYDRLGISVAASNLTYSNVPSYFEMDTALYRAMGNPFRMRTWTDIGTNSNITAGNLGVAQFAGRPFALQDNGTGFTISHEAGSFGWQASASLGNAWQELEAVQGFKDETPIYWTEKRELLWSGELSSLATINLSKPISSFNKLTVVAGTNDSGRGGITDASAWRGQYDYHANIGLNSKFGSTFMDVVQPMMYGANNYLNWYYMRLSSNGDAQLKGSSMGYTRVAPSPWSNTGGTSTTYGINIKAVYGTTWESSTAITSCTTYQLLGDESTKQKNFGGILWSGLPDNDTAKFDAYRFHFHSWYNNQGVEQCVDIPADAQAAWLNMAFYEGGFYNRLIAVAFTDSHKTAIKSISSQQTKFPSTQSWINNSGVVANLNRIYGIRYNDTAWNEPGKIPGTRELIYNAAEASGKTGCNIMNPFSSYEFVEVLNHPGTAVNINYGPTLSGFCFHNEAMRSTASNFCRYTYWSADATPRFKLSGGKYIQGMYPSSVDASGNTPAAYSRNVQPFTIWGVGTRR